MRARNIKPGLLKNEILGVADPLYTLLFEGLWMAADRAGRMEDRPLRLKAEIFPYRDVDMDAMLDWLEAREFILRYEIDGARLIQVLHFAKHQSPHIREQPSTLPAPDTGKAKARRRTVPSTTKAVPSTSAAHLIPDSLIPSSLIPDSLIPDCAGEPAVVESPPEVLREATEPDGLPEFRRAYPVRAGSQPWGRAKAAANARQREGHTWAEFTAGAARYAEFIRATGKEHTELVLQAATFLGPDKHFLERYDLPQASNPGASHATHRRLSAVEQVRQATGINLEHVLYPVGNGMGRAGGNVRADDPDELRRLTAPGMAAEN